MRVFYPVFRAENPRPGFGENLTFKKSIFMHNPPNKQLSAQRKF